MKSLRLKILAIIIPILIIALVTLGSMNYMQAKKLIQGDNKSELIKTAEDERDSVKLWFDVYRQQITTYARSPIIVSGTHEEVMDYLRKEIKSNPLYANILCSDTKGNAYSALGISVNIANRDYFEQALKGKIVISDPIVSLSTGKLVVEIAAPIIKDGNIKGVISASITVDDIVKHILSIRIEKSGYAFLVKKDGLVVIHPDKKVANALNIFTSKNIDTSLKTFGRNMLKSTSGSGKFISNGVSQYAAYSRVPKTDWYLVIQVPKQEVNVKLMGFTKILLATILIVMLIVIEAIILMASHITKPIELLEVEADRISSGEYTVNSVNINLKDEIGRLSRTFEKMVGNLKNNYEELMNTYEALEISNQEIIASDEELKDYNAELHKSKEALRISEERFRLATEGSNIDIWDSDINSNKVSFYKAPNGTGDYNEIDEISKISSRIHPDDIEYVRKLFKDSINKRSPYVECEFREKDKYGKYRWVLCKGKISWNNDGKTIRISGSNIDITERKKIEEKINYMAHYDALTGLANRTLLYDSFSAALDKAKANDKKLALLYIDIDNFKNVNDSLGHNYGNELLKNVSKKLLDCVSKVDIVSRLGGDEFSILLPFIKDNNEINKVLDKIMDMFKVPFVLNGQEFYISASIGIAVYPTDGQDITTMMKSSDTAMYSAKNSGKNKYAFFNTSMNNKVISRLKLENSIRRALEKSEFVVYYQPQMNLRTETISGVEALIRWENPSKGIISPIEFIPIAEETGLIVPIGEFVLKTACKQIRKWNDLGYKNLNMAVNFSARQFKQNNLINSINNIISEEGVNPKNLEFEITETMVMEDIDNTVEILKDIKKSGIKISLDDFGIGYSSLNYLKELPIDVLKMDKEFVLDICENKKQAEIARTIISLAHNLDIEVVAEGVENVEILDLLKEYGCDKAQGYLFSKPVKPESIEKMFSNSILKR